MSKFRVVLEFHYDSDEDISDWNIGDCNIDSVQNADDAIEVAKAELENNSVHELSFNVFDEDGEFLK